MQQIEAKSQTHGDQSWEKRVERGGAVNQQTMGIQPTHAIFHVVRHFSLWIYPPKRR